MSLALFHLQMQAESLVSTKDHCYSIIICSKPPTSTSSIRFDGMYLDPHRVAADSFLDALHCIVARREEESAWGRERRGERGGGEREKERERVRRANTLTQHATRISISALSSRIHRCESLLSLCEILAVQMVRRHHLHEQLGTGRAQCGLYRLFRLYLVLEVVPLSEPRD